MNAVNGEIRVHETVVHSSSRKNELLGWARFILLIAAVFVIVRYGFTLTFISGHSMSPTFHDGNIVLSNNMFYKVERNDIVVFRDRDGYNVIKRVIALPNETVKIDGGIVFVNGNPIDEPFVTGTPHDMTEVVVTDGSYFVMGDNRKPGESLDSRSPEVGTIPRNQIKGEYLFSFIPFGLAD